MPGPGSDRRRRRRWPPGQLDQVQLGRIDVAGAAGTLHADHQGAARGARLDVHGQAATALRLVPGVPGPGSDRRRRRRWPPDQLDQVQLGRIDLAGKQQADGQGARARYSKKEGATRAHNSSTHCIMRSTNIALIPK